MFSARAVELSEIMDRTDCNPEQLARTYKHFGLVNTAVAGWSLLYRRFLTPHLKAMSGKTIRILDIGCGGGDVLRRIVLRARRDGYQVEAVGIDPDERAIRFARETTSIPGITFQATDAMSLVDAGEQFDIVLSNHVLHHLTDDGVAAFCRESEKLTRRIVIHNDIYRHPLAYAGFPLIGGLFPGSYILPDGMRSIRRSFTPTELRDIVPKTWRVHTSLPFRCVLVCQIG